MVSRLPAVLTVVVECAQRLLQAMLSTSCVPEVLQTRKLVLVPKSLSRPSCFGRPGLVLRGVSVSALLILAG